MKKQPLIKETEHILQSKFNIDIEIVKLKGTKENETYVEFLYYKVKHYVTVSIPRYEIQPAQIVIDILQLLTDQTTMIIQGLKDLNDRNLKKKQKENEEDYLYN